MSQEEGKVTQRPATNVLGLLLRLVTEPHAVGGGPRLRWTTLKFVDVGVEAAFRAWQFERAGPWWQIPVYVIFLVMQAGLALTSSGLSALSLFVISLFAADGLLLVALTAGRSVRETERGNRLIGFVVCGFLSLVLCAAPFVQPWVFNMRAGGAPADPAYQGVRDIHFLAVAVALYNSLVLLLFPVLTWRFQTVFTTMVLGGQLVGYLGMVPHNRITFLFGVIDFTCASAYWLFLNVTSYCSEYFRRCEFVSLRGLEHEKNITAREEHRQCQILHTILPEEVATQLLQARLGKRSQDSDDKPLLMAKTHECVTMMFVGVKVETDQRVLDVSEVMTRLSSVFLMVDELCDRHKAEKVKTIGEVIMIAVGAPKELPDNALVACNLASDITAFFSTAGIPKNVRIGLCSGPITSGVVGKTLPKWDCLGDTVNTAYRMFQYADWGQIQLYHTTSDLVDGRIDFTKTTVKNVKGKGTVDAAVMVLPESPKGPLCDEDRGARPMLNPGQAAELTMSRLHTSPSMMMFQEDQGKDDGSVDYTHAPQVKVEGVPASKITLRFHDKRLESLFHKRYAEIYFSLSRLGYSTAVPGTLVILVMCWWTIWIPHQLWAIAILLPKGIELSMLLLLMTPLMKKNVIFARNLLYVGNLTCAILWIVLHLTGVFSFLQPISLVGVGLYTQLFAMICFRESTLTVTAYLLPLFIGMGVLHRPHWDLGIVFTAAMIGMNAVGQYVSELCLRRHFVAARALDSEKAAVVEAKEASRQLLSSLVPPRVLQRMRASPNVVVADAVDDCSILIADVVGFTAMCSEMSASSVVSILDKLYGQIDELVVKSGVQKLKTIGDAYVAIANVSDPCDDHVHRIFEFGVKLVDLLHEFNKDTSHLPMHMRIGMHRGPVTAGVLMARNLMFDCWGSSITIAEAVSAASSPDSLQISQPVMLGLDDSLRSSFEFHPLDVADVRCYQVLQLPFALPNTVSTLDSSIVPHFL